MIIKSKEQLQEAINILNTHDTFSYDIESTGLNVRKDKLIGFGCCSEIDLSKKFYIATHAYIEGSLVELISVPDLAPVFSVLKTKKLITHNGSFDSRLTLHYTDHNLIKNIYADTMLLAHTIDENKFSYALKTLAAEIWGEQEKDEQKAMQESIAANGGTEKEYYKADVDILATYALKDVELTIRLYNHLKPELLKKGLSKFFYEDEVMPLYTKVTIPMEMYGIPVDLDLLNTTRVEIELDIIKLEDEIQSEIKPLLDDFTEWYMNREEFKVVPSGEFLETYARLIAPPEWPKTSSGTHSFSAASFAKPGPKSKKQDKSYLKEHDLYLFYMGLKRPTNENIKIVRQKMLESQDIKYIFNLSSKDHLKRLFFTKLGEIPLSKTDKGAPQVDDDFLEIMADKYSWAKKLRTYNKLNKINSTYVTGTLEKQEDGIFYPNFFQHKTVSGRYGSNIQQLSRPMEPGQAEDVIIKYNNRIRKFFISGAGHTFVDDDYESLEPHVFAHVSNDDGLKNIFKNGDDFYSTIAIATEGLTQYSSNKKADNYLGKLNKLARQNAKAYSLGVPYGMQSYALSMTLEIGQEAADKLINKYLNAYPNLEKWMKDSEDFVRKNGFIKTESGRIRNFPDIKWLLTKYKGIDLSNSLDIWKAFKDSPGKVYEQAKKDGRLYRNIMNNAKNIQIQGLGASIVNRACIALASELEKLNGDAYICAQIHDEVVVRCEDSLVEEVKELTQRCLENTYKISLDLKAVPSTGKNLYEAKG